MDAQGRTVKQQSLTLAPAEFRDRRVDYRLTLPLEQLAPGEYLLTIEATTAGRTVRREVRFAVE